MWFALELVVEQVVTPGDKEMNTPTPSKRSEDRVTRSLPKEELLVQDSRAGITPAQMVERKLIGLLRGKALPVSQLLTAARRGPIG
jgi:hypothetical protein